MIETGGGNISAGFLIRARPAARNSVGPCGRGSRRWWDQAFNLTQSIGEVIRSGACPRTIPKLAERVSRPVASLRTGPNERRRLRLPSHGGQCHGDDKKLSARIEVAPVATGKVDQFAVHLQPDMADEVIIDHLPSVARPAKCQGIAQWVGAGAEQQAADTELWPEAKQPQGDVADASPQQAIATDRSRELDRTRHPRDVGLDVVRHRRTRAKDSMALCAPLQHIRHWPIQSRFASGVAFRI